jgi:hypothetical protein
MKCHCRGKASYPNLSTATELAARFSRLFGVPQRAYRCSECRLWHLARVKWRGESMR